MVAKARWGTKKTRNEKPIRLFIFLSLTWIREKYSFKDKLSMRFRAEIPANSSQKIIGKLEIIINPDF
jgi:hypothetical protein